jgi:hypothetical protein
LRQFDVALRIKVTVDMATPAVFRNDSIAFIRLKASV